MKRGKNGIEKRSEAKRMIRRSLWLIQVQDPDI